MPTVRFVSGARVVDEELQPFVSFNTQHTPDTPVTTIFGEQPTMTTSWSSYTLSEGTPCITESCSTPEYVELGDTLYGCLSELGLNEEQAIDILRGELENPRTNENLIIIKNYLRKIGAI